MVAEASGASASNSHDCRASVFRFFRFLRSRDTRARSPSLPIFRGIADVSTAVIRSLMTQMSSCAIVASGPPEQQHLCPSFYKPKPRMPDDRSDKPNGEDTVSYRPPPELHRKASQARTTPSVQTHESSDEERLPRIGTLARTRRLLLAALRVWELKNGIRD